jgi:hypothetical protein
MTSVVRLITDADLNTDLVRIEEYQRHSKTPPPLLLEPNLFMSTEAGTDLEIVHGATTAIAL